MSKTIKHYRQRMAWNSSGGGVRGPLVETITPDPEEINGDFADDGYAFLADEALEDRLADRSSDSGVAGYIAEVEDSAGLKAWGYIHDGCDPTFGAELVSDPDLSGYPAGATVVEEYPDTGNVEVALAANIIHIRGTGGNPATGGARLSVDLTSPATNVKRLARYNLTITDVTPGTDAVVTSFVDEGVS